jgi:hypothetical protein
VAWTEGWCSWFHNNNNSVKIGVFVYLPTTRSITSLLSKVKDIQRSTLEGEERRAKGDRTKHPETERSKERQHLLHEDYFTDYSSKARSSRLSDAATTINSVTTIAYIIIDSRGEELLKHDVTS